MTETTDISKKDFISEELKKFDIADASIAEMKEQYMTLKVNGVDDKEGYKLVYDAYQIVKKKRIEVEKKGAELRAEATKFNKAVLAEEHRIVGLLEPLEEYLGKEREIVDNEKKRLREEKEKAEEIRDTNRIKKLFELGMKFNGEKYVLGELQLHKMQIAIYSDDQYEAFVAKVELESLKEKMRIEDEERKKKEQEDALNKIKEEQEKETQRLAEIAKAQEEEKARMQAMQGALDKQRKETEELLRKQQEDIDKQKREAQEIKAKGRKTILSSLGLSSNGIEFSLAGDTSLNVTETHINNLSDDDFASYTDQLRPKVERIKAEVEKKKQEEIEKAKAEAIRKANEEAEAKAKKEQEEKLAQEKKEQEETARLEKLRPDREKLEKFAQEGFNFSVPILSEPNAKRIADILVNGISRLRNELIENIKTLK